MTPLSPAFTAALLSGDHGVATRITAIDQDEREIAEWTTEEGYATAGALSIARERQPRRFVDFTLANPGGIWTPRTVRDLLALYRRVKVERGVVLANGSTEWIGKIVGLITNPRTQLTSDDSTVSVVAPDLWRLIMRSRSQEAQAWEPGTGIGQVIREALDPAGFTSLTWDIDDGGAVVSMLLVLVADQIRAEFALKVAVDHGLEVYVRMTTVYIRPVACIGADCPTGPGPHFRAADDLVFALVEGQITKEVTKDVNAEDLYNHTTAGGESTNGPLVWAEARDLDPLSPVYDPPDGSGPIGDQQREPYRSAGITDQVQALQVAETLLLESTFVEHAYGIRALIDPRLDEGDAGHVGPFSDIDADDDVLVDTLSYGLSVGEGQDEMALTSKALRRLV